MKKILISKIMKIGGLQKISLIDYSNKISAVVFCLGCPFRCPFCYNSELVLPEKIKKHPRISEKDFFNFLKERKGLIEGVVLTGGEPCIQKDLFPFVKKIKKMGFLIKLDTNGTNPQLLKKLIKEKMINYVAMDIKQVQNSKLKTQNYNKITGVKVNLENIKKSIDIIKNSGIDYEFRTTVVPTLHREEDIIQIAKEISPAKRYYLQNFQSLKTLNPKFKKIKPYSLEYLKKIQKTISPFFETCEIR